MTSPAETINKMSDSQRANLKNFLFRLIFKCLAVLALIGVIGSLLLMNDKSNEMKRYRNEGAVSRALVLDKNESRSVTVNNRGKRSVTGGYYLHIVHNPKSPVRYADVGEKVKEADIPAESAARSGGSTGSVKVKEEVFARTNKGDILTVVNTPYDPSFPKLLQDVRDFTPTLYYLWAAGFGVLAIALWLLAGRWAKR